MLLLHYILRVIYIITIEATHNIWHKNAFTDEDDFIKFDANITTVASSEVMQIKNFAENWEFNSISNKNSAHNFFLYN